ncbi:MAG: hypothetical protein RL846_33950 [Deltaproteobacteria bacterium]
MKAWLMVVLAAALSGCTLHYSRQAVVEAIEPSHDATFITEEDSGLSLLSLFLVSEPDHFGVLMARAKRRYRCARIHSVQLDYYAEVWLLVSFPIARITAICEPTLHAAPPMTKTSSVGGG